MGEKKTSCPNQLAHKTGHLGRRFSATNQTVSQLDSGRGLAGNASWMLLMMNSRQSRRPADLIHSYQHDKGIFQANCLFCHLPLPSHKQWNNLFFKKTNTDEQLKNILNTLKP